MFVEQTRRPASRALRQAGADLLSNPASAHLFALRNLSPLTSDPPIIRIDSQNNTLSSAAAAWCVSAAQRNAVPFQDRDLFMVFSFAVDCAAGWSRERNVLLAPKQFPLL